MKRHIREVHKKINPFNCAVCDARFLRKENLKGHQDRYMYLTDKHPNYRLWFTVQVRPAELPTVGNAGTQVLVSCELSLARSTRVQTGG